MENKRITVIKGALLSLTVTWDSIFNTIEWTTGYYDYFKDLYDIEKINKIMIKLADKINDEIDKDTDA